MVFLCKWDKVFHVNFCILCLLFISAPTVFRNKVLFPTSGIRARFKWER